MAINLQNGDCLDLMKEIPDGSIDMILCDLPYGTTGSKWDKVISPNALWAEYRRVISSTGAIVLFGTEPFCTEMRYPALGIYKYDWIWSKKTSTGFAHAKNMPLRDYENIMVFSKGSVMHKQKDNGHRMPYNPQGLKDCHILGPTHRETGILHSASFSATGSKYYLQEKTGYPKMTLHFEKEQSDSKYHVNAKPVALLEYLIRTYTNPGETVLDNCMGSGSTGVACVNTGRSFIGMELDPNYFDVAKERIYGGTQNVCKDHH